MKRFTIAIAMIALVVCVSAFGGCATGTPKNAQQTAFTIKANYVLALETANAYGQLPFCNGPSDATVCANRDILQKIKQAKDIAKPAIDAAEAAVRDPRFDASTTDALLVAASKAVAALAEITNALTKVTGTKAVNVTLILIERPLQREPAVDVHSRAWPRPLTA